MEYSISIAATFSFSLLSQLCYADTFVIALDVSGSTPIVTPAFMRAVLPSVGETILKLPIGSRIKVFTVGDDKAEPIGIDLRVQRQKTSQGDAAKELAAIIPNMIAAYLNELRAHPERMQGESSLSPAFLDASKWCQLPKPCKIEYWTDGMEYQPGIISWPKEYQKPLPDIAGLDLKGAEVVMYGVGLGAPSKARIVIEQHWQTWLKAHNAGSVDIRRL